MHERIDEGFRKAMIVTHFVLSENASREGDDESATWHFEQVIKFHPSLVNWEEPLMRMVDYMQLLANDATESGFTVPQISSTD